MLLFMTTYEQAIIKETQSTEKQQQSAHNSYQHEYLFNQLNNPIDSQGAND